MQIYVTSDRFFGRIKQIQNKLQRLVDVDGVLDASVMVEMDPYGGSQYRGSTARRWRENDGPVRALLGMQSWDSLQGGRLLVKYYECQKPPQDYRYTESFTHEIFEGNHFDKVVIFTANLAGTHTRRARCAFNESVDRGIEVELVKPELKGYRWWLGSKYA